MVTISGVVLVDLEGIGLLDEVCHIGFDVQKPHAIPSFLPLGYAYGSGWELSAPVLAAITFGCCHGSLPWQTQILMEP